MSTILVACLQLLILDFEMATSEIITKSTNIVVDDRHSVLCTI